MSKQSAKPSTDGRRECRLPTEYGFEIESMFYLPVVLVRTQMLVFQTFPGRLAYFQLSRPPWRSESLAIARGVLTYSGAGCRRIPGSETAIVIA